MRTICFYFQVHQPFRLRRYRFFDIGNDHHYYDDFANRTIMRKVADKCYLPTNQLMYDLIQEYETDFALVTLFQAQLSINLKCMPLRLLKVLKD